MSQNTAKTFLEETGWLARLPEAFRQNLLERCVARSIPKGERVLNLDTPPNGLWGVVSGSLGVEIAPAEQGPHFVHIMRPGSWFGEAELALGMPRIGSITTIEPCFLLHLAMSELNRLSEQEPETWRCVCALSSEHLALSFCAVSDLMRRDSGQRVAAVLLRLADCRLALPEENASLSVAVSREDLARMSNVSRTTVTQIITGFEDAGLVASGYRSVQLVDPAGLHALLEE